MSVGSVAKRLRALLQQGYFPKELPPVFTTSDFGEHAPEVLIEWEKKRVFQKCPEKLGKNVLRGNYSYKVHQPDAEVLSCPKRGFERRDLRIPHPIPHALLCREIAENWSKISRWLAKGQFSIDNVSISSQFERSVPDLNFGAHRARKAYIEANSDWVVKTDITRFYPSIYTHSIVWAAYGKERVKKNLKYYRGSLADRLDCLVRACNRNQTIGIPIGPETSRIIADIISTRIDYDFSSHRAEFTKINTDRLQDDWFIGTESLHKAEIALTTLMKCYREYGLEINGGKTSVDRTISPLSENWISELDGFLAHASGKMSRIRLREFLSLTLRLQLDFQKDPVISYALSVVESMGYRDVDVETLESFLVRSATAAPGAMNRICAMLLNLQHATKSLSVDRIKSRFIQLAERCIENERTYELAWLLFTLRGLRIRLKSKQIIGASEYLPSSAIILLLLDMDRGGLIGRQLPRGSWESAISEERITQDWSWLYAYEGVRRGWLKDCSGKLLKHPFLAPMASRQIAFYDERRNVLKRQRTLQIRRAKAEKQRAQTMLFIQDLRGTLQKWNYVVPSTSSWM